MKIPILLAVGALTCASAFSQKPAERGTSDDLLRQPEPGNGAAPAFRGQPLPGAATDARPAEAPAPKPVVKKDKGPTEIDALEATFNQKTNEAVFIGDVIVKDPEFNVTCDKLTAQLKSAEKTTRAANGPGKPATPTPATPAPTAGKKKGGGLHKAVAEAAAGGRVLITQDKTDPDGTVQRSTGRADKAVYDAVTGDIVLTGQPEVQQGINLVVATAQGTRMTLNRDGTMRADGPHKTIIVDKGSSGL